MPRCVQLIGHNAFESTRFKVLMSVSSLPRSSLPRPSLPGALAQVPFPVIAAPLFLISNPALLIAQCIAGVVGSLPALNARPSEQLRDWLAEITETLDAHNRAHPEQPAAPFAINQIVHKSNDRLQSDMELCMRYKVPIIITSLGAVAEINQMAHSYGGVVMHDVINNRFARKAIEKGADGLVCVCAGAGGHAGVKSPFAFMQEIREWFDGPIALSGSIANGRSILASQALGADFAYMGSVFIATHESKASEAYKACLTQSNSDDILYTNAFTGVHGNYLIPSIRGAGLDPDHLEPKQSTEMNFSSSAVKAWRDIWGAGQGVGAITEVSSAQNLIKRLRSEYEHAKAELYQQIA